MIIGWNVEIFEVFRVKGLEFDTDGDDVGDFVLLEKGEVFGISI